jgi:hypothetical protein
MIFVANPIHRHKNVAQGGCLCGVFYS